MATMYEKMMERLVDRVADQAVEIAKLKQEAENLKKEMAYYDNLHQKVREELDQVREERDCFLADLRLRQVELRQNRERLEMAWSLAEAVSALQWDSGFERYEWLQVKACIEQADALLHPEQKEVCDGRA